MSTRTKRILLFAALAWFGWGLLCYSNFVLAYLIGLCILPFALGVGGWVLSEDGRRSIR